MSQEDNLAVTAGWQEVLQKNVLRVGIPAFFIALLVILVVKSN